MVCTGPPRSCPVCVYSEATSGIFASLGCLVHLWCGSVKAINLWSHLQSEVELPDWSAPFSVLLSAADCLMACCDLLAALVSEVYPERHYYRVTLLQRSPLAIQHSLGVYIWTEPRLHRCSALLVMSVVGVLSVWPTLGLSLIVWSDGGGKVLLCICD